MIASCVDILARTESENRFQKIAQHSLSGIVKNNDEGIFYANPAASEMVGEELVRKCVQQFILVELSPYSLQLKRALQFERNSET